MRRSLQRVGTEALSLWSTWVTSARQGPCTTARSSLTKASTRSPRRRSSAAGLQTSLYARREARPRSSSSPPPRRRRATPRRKPSGSTTPSRVRSENRGRGWFRNPLHLRRRNPLSLRRRPQTTRRPPAPRRRGSGSASVPAAAACTRSPRSPTPAARAPARRRASRRRRTTVRCSGILASQGRTSSGARFVTCVNWEQRPRPPATSTTPGCPTWAKSWRSAATPSLWSCGARSARTWKAGSPGQRPAPRGLHFRTATCPWRWTRGARGS
mmetsp:Transcript_27353/g.94047  ORF Transcript_27353/g.94047 Transcript_27353/m.94047 type:complete len:270 (-) Transcript_27353:2061-2870(-)